MVNANRPELRPCKTTDRFGNGSGSTSDHKEPSSDFLARAKCAERKSLNFQETMAKVENVEVEEVENVERLDRYSVSTQGGGNLADQGHCFVYAEFFNSREDSRAPLSRGRFRGAADEPGDHGEHQAHRYSAH